MLILTRRVNEAIFIYDDDGNSIEIKVLEQSQNQTRIGINAPDDFNIVRTELIYRDAKEGKI